MTTLLVSGDIVACWQGWAYMNYFAVGRRQRTPSRRVVPEEGSFTFADAYAIPSTVDNVDTAHAWINQCSIRRSNAENAVYLVAGVTVEAAQPLLDEATASLYDYSDVESFFAAAPLYNAPPHRVGRVRHDSAQWQETVAGDQGERVAIID